MKTTPVGTIHLTITADHVTTMLEAYDSEMCDRTRSNALWFALENYILNSKSLRVIRRDHQLILKYETETMIASSKLWGWLGEAERGFAEIEHAAFDLEIPLAWLKRSTFRKTDDCHLDSEPNFGHDQIAA